MSRTRVVGVGNPDRGDDGVGPVVAAEVAARAAPDVEVLVSMADPSQLLYRWGDADTVVLVDAIVNGRDPGAVAVFDLIADGLPAEVATLSSHGLGIPETVELARSLGRLPDRLVVVAVTGKEFEGHGLTEEVENAVEDAVLAVMEVVEDA